MRHAAQHSVARSSPARRSLSRTAFPWTPIALTIFLALTAGLAAAAPGLLRLVFPALALMTGVVLFVNAPRAYVCFSLWLWFLSPLLRRLVDFRTDFVATSPLLLAPLVVACIPAVLLATHLRALARPAALPFAAAGAALAFGTLHGLMRYQPVEVGRALLNWTAPLAFALLLYLDRRNCRAYADTVRQSLLWATLLLGLYGVVQFFLLPPWDEAWMIGLHDGAFGEPVARGLRVFSTMNAPVAFAYCMVVGVLVALRCAVVRLPGEPVRQRWLALAALGPGLLALALTTSRALWLGLLCGMVALFALSRGRARPRLAAAMLVLTALGSSSLVLPGVREVVMSRVRTLTAGSSDVSAHARLAGHLEGLRALAAAPLGEGLGSTDVDHATDGSDDRIGPHDSTLLEMSYSLGLPGALVYATGLAAAVLALVRRRARTDPALAAAAVGLLAQCALTSLVVGVSGMFLWMCLTLAAEDVRASGF